ncbi:MAG: hypothetical protein MPJ50_04135 [Pirellulales bacterium]|nr:hypothetical protein [Pirellulales bacterium]
MAPSNNSSPEDRPKSLLDLLAKPRPKFRDESLAPVVDRNLLWALVRNKLPEAEQRGAYRLIYSFRSWDEAHTEILTEHYHQTVANKDATDKGEADTESD